MHNTLERDYTPVSSPSDPTLALCIRKLEEGVISPLLASAEMGTQIHFTGPYGYFTFRASPRSAVFVATGTGIAPFVSMGRSGIGGFILLHGVRTPHELYYESLFRTKARRYVPCVSGVPLRSSAPLGTFYGKVTDYIKEHLPKGPYDFYLCGRGDMIRDVTLLVDERFSGSFIYAEIFY
jgi:ferredoxin-NADP reductase